MENEIESEKNGTVLNLFPRDWKRQSPSTPGSATGVNHP